MRLRFGIIGCGRVAPRHAQSIAQLDSTEAAAYADIKLSRAEKFAAEYGGAAYADYRALLDRPDIDAVSICVPSGLHAAVAIDAMQAGKHVLVEKPIAIDLADADRMIRTAQEQGVTLAVVLQNRYNHPMQQLRALIDSGGLGRLYLGNATVRWFRPQSYYEDDWHGTWRWTALMNQSIHHIDVAMVLGPVAPAAYTATLAHDMEADTSACSPYACGGAWASSKARRCRRTWRIGRRLWRAHCQDRRNCAQPHHAVEGPQLEQEAEISPASVDPPSVYCYSHREDPRLRTPSCTVNSPTPPAKRRKSRN